MSMGDGICLCEECGTDMIFLVDRGLMTCPCCGEEYEISFGPEEEMEDGTEQTIADDP